MWTKMDPCGNPLNVASRVVFEAGTSETETQTWVAETKTETEAI